MVISVILCSVFLGDAITWWLADRWIRRHGNRRSLRWSLALFMALMLGYMVTMFAIMALRGPAGRSAMSAVPTVVVAVIYAWHLVVLPLTLLAWIIGGAASGTVFAAKHLRRRKAEPSDAARPPADAARSPADAAQSPAGAARSPADAAHPPASAGISRRQFVAGMAVLPPLLAIGASGYGLIESRKFRIRRLTLPIASLPRELNGFTIAQISDVHVGQWTTDAFLDEVVDAANGLGTDLTLMTGDLIDFAIADLPRGIDMIRRLRARRGVYLCEGNHDLIEDPSAFHRMTRQAGLNMLIGQQTVFKHNGAAVQLLGIPWSRSPAMMRLEVEQIDRLRRPDAFPILLAHHPHAFDTAAEADFPLTLSGHTHGGQLMLTSQFGAGNLLFHYTSGLYRQGKNLLVVSNGTGNWLPLRINAPAEILHLTLMRYDP